MPFSDHMRALYRNGRKHFSMEDENTKRRCRCRFGLKCKFLVLTILVIAYVVGGAWLFVGLEQENQKNQQKEFDGARENLFKNLSDILDGYDVDNATKIHIKKLIDNYVDPMYKASAPLMWDWTSGCFFCITILTTIGYGRMVPQTMWGKVACIAYAVIGIPLFLIFLAKLGDILVNAIRRCHRKCCVKKKKRAFSSGFRNASSKHGSKKGNGHKDDDSDAYADTDIPISPFIVVFILYIGAGSGIFYKLQDGWDFVDAIYFTVVTFTTIGFGDLVPAYGENQRGGLSSITDITQKLSGDLNLNVDFNITEKQMEYIRHADFALLIWYIIIGMVIMSCIFNLLLVRLRHLSDLLSTKRRRDKFALNQNTFDMSGEGQIRKVPVKY
ncbi:potassium channel, subfamily K, member 16-like isoform X3 [Ptychodera flava]|uniref:potassium channel, subfamily K, member 16-like isoform X3 n=1 Tax=Ptychodera flava TaxID=63121 RepID=UPI00396A6A5F